MFKEEYYENIGYDLFYKFEDFRNKYYSLLTISQISFLLGLISNYQFTDGRKIENVLEIGVCNGVTSLYMLKTGCKFRESYKQYGIDIDSRDFCANAVFQEANEDELKSFSMHKGKTVLNISEIIEKNAKLDLVFIDGGHSHPHPLIDLVSVIPYLHEESIVCLHDVVDYMRPNAWGESFIFEIWSDEKYRNINKQGHKETLGVIKIPKNKDVLYKMLLDLAKIPFRAAPWMFDDKYLGIDKSVLIQLRENLLKNYEASFVEEFITSLNKNLNIYNEEYILRIHETRFYNYLYEKLSMLNSRVNNLEKLLSEKNLLAILENHNDKNILFWGASLYLEKFIENNDLSKYNIIGIIDTNAGKKTYLKNYKIYAPNEITTLNADLIVSCVLNSHKSVYEQIKQYIENNKLQIDLAPDIFNHY